MSTFLMVLFIALLVMFFLVLMTNVIVMAVRACTDFLGLLYDRFHDNTPASPSMPVRNTARYLP